jgi:neopullulanase
MTLLNEDLAAVKLAFLCQMTVPGAPNIYYGDEIGLTGRTDPFCRGAYPWGKPDAGNSELLTYVQQLTQLRHRLPALRRGSFEVVATSGPAIVYQRRLGGALAVVALNPGDSDVTLEVPQIAAERLAEERLGNDQGIATESSQGVTIPARSGRLWTTG